MKDKKVIYIIVSFLIGVLIYDFLLNPKNNIKRQKLDLSIDIGKILFINNVLKNKNKTYKQIDSIYEIRKDSILDILETTN